MDVIAWFVDFFLHLDVYLGEIIEAFGPWTYAILFMIIFLETGVVITPFLPGDSLLFAAGTFAGLGLLDPILLFILLTTAAVLGDALNYFIGTKLGPPVFERNYRFLNKEHLEKTQKFYEKHGGKTIVLARFVPIVRTFAPFVAGVGTMKYSRFAIFNVTGAILWTSIFIFGGHFFGNIPFVKENFEIVILSIIAISVLPMVYEFVQGRISKSRAAREQHNARVHGD